MRRLSYVYREKIRYLEQGGEEMGDILANYPREPPELQPPQFKKEAVYENNMAVFEVIDETSKNAAKDNWKTFTKLVRHLVGRCSSDVDKARAGQLQRVTAPSSPTPVEAWGRRPGLPLAV